MHKPKPPFLNKKIHFCLIFGTFSKVSFDRSRWAELRNLVFGILPENFGQFSGLRKKSAIFQGHRFETRDFFLFFKNFNRILPIYIKIPIYIKNYADFNGKWIILLRCLVFEDFKQSSRLAIETLEIRSRDGIYFETKFLARRDRPKPPYLETRLSRNLYFYFIL